VEIDCDRVKLMNQEVAKEDLNRMRHTAAHVLAAASTQLRSETRLGVGPGTDDGFFHDIDVDDNYTEEDLKALEKKMRGIQKMNLKMKHYEVDKDEARKLFKDDPYKLELIDEIEDEKVGVSEMGDGFFVTLCEGGHVESTGKIGVFKLTRMSGVYWKNDESRPQLQRIYGLLFPTQEELDQHLERLDEAKKRDHRKIGKELDLFTFSKLAGSGLPLFTPKGTIMLEELRRFVEELHTKQGYSRVTIPHLARPDLYKTSGHWDKFKDDLFHIKGKHKEEFVMKPMNCPHHTQIYASKLRSYRDLPIRYAESTTVYRDEQAGELQGLTRVRSITQDDGHVFCRADQVEEEINRILTMVEQFYQALSLKLSFRLSLSDPDLPEKYLGTREIWEKAEEALRKVLRDKKIEFSEVPGEAAFYGPKIDFTALDSIGREWQLATIQLDFNMPERFGLVYTDEEGNPQTPIMIHRAIMGSYERFLGVIIEHYAGAFPLWLAPVQVAVLPIADDQLKYAEEVTSKLREMGLRIEMDSRGESIGKKIREAQNMKIPVMLVIGKREVEAGTVSVRSREHGDEGAKVVAEVASELAKKVKDRT
jgi:threonyl-tRNA synthetase